MARNETDDKDDDDGVTGTDDEDDDNDGVSDENEDTGDIDDEDDDTDGTCDDEDDTGESSTVSASNDCCFAFLLCLRVSELRSVRDNLRFSCNNHHCLYPSVIFDLFL